MVHNPSDRILFFLGSKEKARENLGWRHDEVIILFVGKLISPKGVDLFIEAAAMLLRTSELRLRLIINRDGPQKASWKISWQRMILNLR